MKALSAGASLSSSAGQSCFAHDLKVLSRRQDCPEPGAHERVVVDQQHLELVRPASLLATGDLTAELDRPPNPWRQLILDGLENLSHSTIGPPD